MLFFFYLSTYYLSLYFFSGVFVYTFYSLSADNFGVFFSFLDFEFAFSCELSFCCGYYATLGVISLTKSGKCNSDVFKLFSSGMISNDFFGAFLFSSKIFKKVLNKNNEVIIILLSYYV